MYYIQQFENYTVEDAKRVSKERREQIAAESLNAFLEKIFQAVNEGQLGVYFEYGLTPEREAMLTAKGFTISKNTSSNSFHVQW
jgi:hypothetical protein